MVTMEEVEYGIMKAIPSIPVRDLLRVPHNGGNLVVSYPAFGPNTYSTNLAKMEEEYTHSEERQMFSFRPATTSESISAAAYEFEELAKPQIFDPRWLQVGYIVRTQDGVFTNTNETDERKLKQLLNGVEKVNGIYFINDKIGFAPYDSFETQVQDVDTFTQGGLARVLEHTYEKTAPKFREIASLKNYKRGVIVLGFDKVKEPVLRVASLYSYRYFDDGRLGVDGDWNGGSYGYAFGVLDETGEASSQNS